MLVKFCHSVPSNNLTELHPYSETTDNGRLSFIMALYFHCIFSLSSVETIAFISSKSNAFWTCNIPLSFGEFVSNLF